MSDNKDAPKTEFNHWLFRRIFYGTLILRKEWFIPELQALRDSQYYPLDSLRALQLSRLNKLLAHASNHVAHYQGALPDNLQSLDQLATLPFLEKEDLRGNREQLTCRYGEHQRLKTSGGSTGAPVSLLKDNRGMAKEMAAMWRGYSWAGVEPGDRQARFWGVPRNKKEKLRSQLIDFVCNRKRVTAFEYNKETMRSSVPTIKRFDPDYFYGYTSILKEFALAQPNDSQIRPKAIITTSEVLSNSDRNVIESTFQSKVFDEYGCGEVGTIAHECEYGSKHINAENVILEVVDDKGNQLPAGESGELVVTDLTNFSTPMIRYRLKDFGSVEHRKCPCSRTLPILSNLHGRAYDILENSKGNRFHGEFFLYIIEDLNKNGVVLDGVQFVQNNDHSITIKLIADDVRYERSKQYITKRLFEDFDKNAEITFEKVDSIPREPSGKLRVIKIKDKTRDCFSE